jgi:hypothetical protein
MRVLTVAVSPAWRAAWKREAVRITTAESGGGAIGGIAALDRTKESSSVKRAAKAKKIPRVEGIFSVKEVMKGQPR